MSSDGFSTPASVSSSEDGHAGVGLSNPGLSRGRRQMLDHINRLHNTGVQGDMDLPMIAVIGSQSAGKSSLIEAISGITLPRAAGTCTRCPTECRLAYSTEPWKCLVSLRYITDQHGQPLGSAKNILFGPPITDKSEVEGRIRRAQRAILNPAGKVKDFLEGDYDAQEPSLTFSHNYISLSISGPDVADLSFVDLPGLIASVGQGGNAGDIEMVESLVKSWIQKPSCIILLTVACETDFMNQKAHHLAEKFDPEGKRTIGVLTKPDRIPHGEEDSWLKLIRGESQYLFNGWFCVKQPSSTELRQGTNWAQARDSENAFFSSKQPWASLESVYQRQLRTNNLTERLSLVLSDLISKRLPEIQDELQRLIVSTEGRIQRLPRPPSTDPVGEVLKLITNFHRHVQQHVEGTHTKDGILQQIRPAQEEFKSSIRSTAPDFRPYTKEESDRFTLPPPSFLSNEENVSPGRNTADTNTKAIYIDEVYKFAEDARTRELPDNHPFIVKKIYIQDIIKQWKTPTRILLEVVFAQLSSHLKEIITEHFADFSNGGLHQRVVLLLTEHLKNRMEKASEKLQWLLDIEELPYTMNEHYFLDYREKFLSYYKGTREQGEHQKLFEALKSLDSGVQDDQTTVTSQNINAVLSGLNALGINGVKKEDLPKLLPPDVYESALSTMANVRAYFQVAYKRFTDNIPMAIDYELVRGLTTDLENTLFTGLNVSGPDSYRSCKELLQEHPTISAQREELTNKLERLRNASQELVRMM